MSDNQSTLTGLDSIRPRHLNYESKIMTKRKIEGQFAMVPQRAIRELSDSPLNVYIALCMRANSEASTCYPSWNRIAEDTGLCRSAVHRALKKLVADGWITKVQRGSSLQNRANLYKVHDAPSADSVSRGTIDSVSRGTIDSVSRDTLTYQSTYQSIYQPKGNLKTNQDTNEGFEFDVVIDNDDSEPSEPKATTASLDFDF